MLAQANAATVSGTTSGIRIAAPHRPLSRMSRRWSASAAARPMTNWPMIAEKATKIRGPQERLLEVVAAEQSPVVGRGR